MAIHVCIYTYICLYIYFLQTGSTLDKATNEKQPYIYVCERRQSIKRMAEENEDLVTGICCINILKGPKLPYRSRAPLTYTPISCMSCRWDQLREGEREGEEEEACSHDFILGDDREVKERMICMRSWDIRCE